jgi:hypothetical protein
MKTQRLLVALTVLNILLLVFSLGQTRTVVAEGAAPVLRGRALEIVDDRGRVRASITVLPADPTVKMPDGTVGYPETVLLRLITSKGRPKRKDRCLGARGGTGPRRRIRSDLCSDSGGRSQYFLEVEQRRRAGATDQALVRSRTR